MARVIPCFPEGGQSHSTAHRFRHEWRVTGARCSFAVGFTDGRIYVRGKIHTRGAQKRADYILYYKPNIPIAVLEAKDNYHTVGAGIQQALGYAQPLDTSSLPAK